MVNTDSRRAPSPASPRRNALALLCATLVALTGTDAPTDAQSSVKVTQLTRGPRHHYFGYIGQSRTIPWNASGRYVLALRVAFQDRLPGAGDPAEICLIDAHDNYAIRVVDATRGWNPQQGTMFYWNPEHPETQFFFNDRDRATGKVFTVLFDIAADDGKGRRIRQYRFDDQPVGNGGVAQNGGYFMAINYARMARLRPVTGYAEAWDWTKDAGAPADDGVFRIDVRTGERKLVVSFARLKDALRGTVENLDGRHFFINHTLNNRNNDLVYFFCRADFEQQVNGPRVNAVFTVHPDGSGLTRHETFIGGASGVGVGSAHHRIVRRPPGRVRLCAEANRRVAWGERRVSQPRRRRLAEPGRPLVRERPSRRGVSLLHVPGDEDAPRREVGGDLSLDVEPWPAEARSRACLESHERRHRRTGNRRRWYAPDVPASAVPVAPSCAATGAAGLSAVG